MIVETVILAAGNGSRMLSGFAKVMHPIAGRSMLSHVMETGRKISSSPIKLVIDRGLIDELPDFGEEIRTVIQERKLGTAHAVESAMGSLDPASDMVVVLYADSPFITSHTVKELISLLSQEDNVGIGIVAFEPQDSRHQYGRLAIDERGMVTQVLEHREVGQSTDAATTFANSGLMVFKSEVLKTLIDQVKNENSSNEYRLTDLIKIAAEQMGQHTRCVLRDESEAMGINTQHDLLMAERNFQSRLRNNLLDAGIIITDPTGVHLSFDTVAEAGVIIHPNVFIGTGVSVGSGSVIWPFTFITESKIGKNVNIGPFAYLRGNNVVETGCSVSGFTELKSSHLKPGTTIKHLSYIGDSEVGCKTNIGAGTVVCNYDGHKKHHSQIGDNCFIGANNTLIAPVVIGEQCSTGAGSCITDDIPSHHNALARSRQINRRKKTLHPKLHPNVKVTHGKPSN